MDLNDLADQLNDLSPPEEIQDAHEKLVESLRQFSDDPGEISSSLADAAESEDPGAAFEILGQLVALESVSMLQEVQTGFRREGLLDRARGRRMALFSESRDALGQWRRGKGRLSLGKRWGSATERVGDTMGKE